jgi:hypothetical protein
MQLAADKALCYLAHSYTCIAVMLWNCILEMFGSNLGYDAAILTGDFRDFPQSLQQNTGIVAILDHDFFLFPSKSLF